MLFPTSIQINQKIEFKNRLRFVDSSNCSTEAQVAQARAALQQLEEAEKEQELLELGVPEFSMYRERANLEKMISQDIGNQIAKITKPIFEPSKKFFLRFDRRVGSRMTTNSRTLPSVVMVKLEKQISGIEIEVDSSSDWAAQELFRADIPLIPRVHLEIAKRVKALDSNAVFHILYIPEWVKVEIEDPALVVFSGGEWFQIGTAWAGDAEIINGLLQPKE